MLVGPLNLCFFLLMLNSESVLALCEVRVRILNFGCHLDWECPDANPDTTYTVQSRTSGKPWKNVSDCIQISRKSCNLSHVTNINVYNYIKLSSEEQLGIINETYCNPMNDEAPTFSPPSVTISMENQSLWVTVYFPCAPSTSCNNRKETHCPCSISDHTVLSVTVILYNKNNPSDTQIRSVGNVEEISIREEFGFIISGNVYCAVANFTSEGPPVSEPSPPSPPQCIYIPAKIESLIVMVVCAVIVALVLACFLLWRLCGSSERPLPKSLASLYDQEIQNATFIDSSKAAPDRESSEGDKISIVSLYEFTLIDNQSYYHSSQSLGKGYYKSPMLQDPNYIEDSAGVLAVESEGLEIDEADCFELLWTSNVMQERGERYPYLSETPNIPLSSVRVKCAEREETTAGPELCGDVTGHVYEETCRSINLCV
ncbi:uncharacterized protein [Paramisgurnus dabryanus]|uniref:uncharacterized protein n=1 Tax=Paramisgurnus dabryanus TaxID=90735 RepID=UPI0031F3D705